ncbi:MAG: efflux RND transporter periplasmic adaptor subunit [Bacillota bacterium]|nr:efflux RND transporter periplasmic adaptor subunit [Bacillota bacterium]
MKISKKGKIVTIAILVLILMTIGYFINQNASKLDVDYYTIKKGDVSSEISGHGKVNSDSIITKYALVSGEAVYFNCDIGDYVKKDDVIVKINKDNINFQIEGINAQIENLNYMLKEAVKPMDKERINSLEYSVSSAKISLERNVMDLKKSEELYNQGAISLDELNFIKDQESISRNQLYSLQNDLVYLRKSVSSNIELQYASQIEVLEASKKGLLKSLDNCEIKASIDGVITEKYIQEGEFVMQGTPIFEITDFNDIKIIADVLESEIMNISIGMEVIVEDIVTNEKVEGNVIRIYPKVYEELTELGIKQKKVNVEIKADKLSNGYLLNQELELEFITNKLNEVISIPVDSYFEENNKYYVFTNVKGKATKKEITIGLIGDDFVEVSSGLKIGDKIIEVMQNEILEGSKIN